LIDWCLTPTLAIFQIYRDVNKFYYQLRVKVEKLSFEYSYIVQVAVNFDNKYI